METFNTKYGVLNGITLYTIHENEMLQDCILAEQVDLHTPYGILTPQYTYDYRRKNNYAVSFYFNGSLKRVSLEHATDITTPLGIISTELITFYENGSIKRIFPLNGQISAFWEEEDEYQLAKDLSLDFSFGKIVAKVISICFYENGNVKTLTFWPNQKVKLQTPLTVLNIRIGISLYPDGCLKSVEPAYPTKIHTQLGALLAYDKDANGITGDINSLCFTSTGILSSLITSGNQITVTNSSGHTKTYSPYQEVDIDGIEISFHPLHIEFDQDLVIFNHETKYNIPTSTFIIKPYMMTAISQCEDCESCGKQCSNSNVS